MPFDRQPLGPRLAALARQGVFIGTSSWKYPGWCGMLYDAARYEWRGKFAVSRFERNCLAEYAEVFRTVCVDAAYYAFPKADYLQGLAGQVPPGFLFGFKVTDEITLRQFPNLARFGERAGKANGNFLNADLFAASFLGPCEAVRAHVGLLLFEFTRFHAAEYTHGRDFLADLDGFLRRLPPGWPYAVEVRNRNLLRPEYFACLARHNVAHVFNSWEAMPPVSEQLAMPGSRTSPTRVAARFLLKPGRRYEEAVGLFQPYDRVKEQNPDARQAGKTLVAEGQAAGPDRKTFIYVNNRLEGNALETISAILE
jgi:uncharacterized protein YecE (DUF72 family)